MTPQSFVCTFPEYQLRPYSQINDTTNTKVRNQIVKWQRKEQNKIIQSLTENHDYEIQVCYSDSEPSISIMCKKCSKKCALGLKGQSILLSNWKRHVSSCIVKKHGSKAILKGTQLHNFFKVASSIHSKPENDDISFRNLFLETWRSSPTTTSLFM